MKSEKISVLFASFEADPFMKTGGLGDVGGSLPAALKKAGANVRLIMPKFGTIPEEYRAQMVHVADFTVSLSWRNQYCGIEKLTKNGVVCYFIDNEYYFRRDKAYGFYDDGERIAFFAKAVLDCIPHLPGFKPDVIHCNDWHTALTPVFLKAFHRDDPLYSGIRTVFTIHNLKFQGIYPRSCCGDLLGLSDAQACALGLAYEDTINYMRGALCCADRLTTVSPTYAEEICLDFYGENAQDIFRHRKGDLSGILNGISYGRYSPRTDKLIDYRYTVKTVQQNKAKNKLQLQASLGLAQRADVPMLALISRLTDQKGLDLLVFILHELMEQDIQLVILGVGDDKYEQAFRAAAQSMPDKMAAVLTFSEPLSHRIYAAADMVLVPSLFEPCGLTQMIAMSYGALPIVRETGGLKDSVIPFNKETGEGTGFSFANYNAHELLFTAKRAVELYTEKPDVWHSLVCNAMAQDFSWNASAEKYMALYRSVLGKESAS